MAKKKDSEVKEYTASWLLQDLQRQIELEEENAKQKREKTEKNTFYDKSVLRDLNFLLNLNVENVDKKEEVEDFVKMLVSQNEPLFGFTFFLSSNPHFDYNWSYLRKQCDNFQAKLTALYLFFNDMFLAVNSLVKLEKKYKKCEFVFNGLFCLSFQEGSLLPEITLKWDKFNNLLSVEHGISITVMEDKLLLFAMKCKRSDKDELKDAKIEDSINVLIDKFKDVWKGYHHE